jgi:hypothetical protein
VQDSHGRTLCYIYCRDDEKNAEIANVLTWEDDCQIQRHRTAASRAREAVKGRKRSLGKAEEEAGRLYAQRVTNGSRD